MKHGLNFLEGFPGDVGGELVVYAVPPLLLGNRAIARRFSVLRFDFCVNRLLVKWQNSFVVF